MLKYVEFVLRPGDVPNASLVKDRLCGLEIVENVASIHVVGGRSGNCDRLARSMGQEVGACAQDSHEHLRCVIEVPDA